ncbi:MAG: outer membrane lipoprotein carrier protein LolA [Burkholderiaceae bacterium]
MSLLARRPATSRFVLWLVVFVLGLLALLVHANQARAAQPPDARAQLERFVERARSASGRFEQLAGPAGAASRGVFAFARPGRFRWEVVAPYPQLMIADGTQVIFYDVDLAQVTIRPMDQAISATPAALLFGDGDLNEAFEIVLEGEHEGLQWLRATPRQTEAGFERITIGFADDVPVRMSVLDAFDRTTVFVFSDIEINPSLPPERFRFEIPDGVDVVRP